MVPAGCLVFGQGESEEGKAGLSAAGLHGDPSAVLCSAFIGHQQVCDFIQSEHGLSQKGALKALGSIHSSNSVPSMWDECVSPRDVTRLLALHSL